MIYIFISQNIFFVFIYTEGYSIRNKNNLRTHGVNFLFYFRHFILILWIFLQRFLSLFSSHFLIDLMHKYFSPIQITKNIIWRLKKTSSRLVYNWVYQQQQQTKKKNRGFTLIKIFYRNNNKQKAEFILYLSYLSVRYDKYRIFFANCKV